PPRFAPRHPTDRPAPLPHYLPFATVRSSALTQRSSTRPASAPDFELHSLEPHHIAPLIQMISKVAQLPNRSRQKESRRCTTGSGEQTSVQTLVLQLLQNPHRSAFIEFHIQIESRLVVFHGVRAMAGRTLCPLLSQKHIQIVC